MASLKIYDCDIGIKINGVGYSFVHVDSLTIEDPENTKLIRGANASNMVGLVYKEGIKEAKKITVTIKDMDIEIKALLDTAYADRTRLDVYCINKFDGSSKIGKDAILCQMPQQLTIDESAESMDVALIFETFNLKETFKTA